MSGQPILRVWTWERPWWALKLWGRWREIVMEPPPDASIADVENMAAAIRATGAGVRIEQEKAA